MGNAPSNADNNANAIEEKNTSKSLIKGQPWTTPSLNMQLVYVAPVTFQTGMNAEYSKGKPAHSVTISQGYWIGKHEVTHDEFYYEYNKAMASSSSEFKGGDEAVETVTWGEAVDFCQKLTSRERTAGRLPDGYEYRLPTEAEWEFAVRSGATSKGYGKETHEVGSKSANELDIYDYDIEWCLDDGHGTRLRDCPSSHRKIRGGGWHCYTSYCRVTVRPDNSSDGSLNYCLSFRVGMAPISK